MDQTNKVEPGLSTLPEKEWPKLGNEDLSPIQRLRPGSSLHTYVLDYLNRRIDMSEDEMSKFYPRWRANERQMQAYVDLPNYEKLLEEQNRQGKPAQIVQLTLPYSFATQSTTSTYLLHTFAGRKPMFQIGQYKSETAESSRLMELVIQYQADHTRLIRHLWQHFNDCGTYGVGILRTEWKTEKKYRTVWKTRPNNILGISLGEEKYKARELRTVYEGTLVEATDPFMFFPDPRVPMAEVNKKGEFVFWRAFQGRHLLKDLESSGLFKWVDYAGAMPTARYEYGANQSVRHLISGGESSPGWDGNRGNHNIPNYVQIDQGSVTIIPEELGLAKGRRPEKWIFTILNKYQIVQAEPMQADHDMHPVCVSEPYTMGYGFGQPGMADYMGPIQDSMSWFINSHIQNVRTALNNMFVVDPSMIEMQDLKNPQAGKLIRLKRAAYGQDVKSALTQLSVADVTRNHVQDLELFMRMGDALSSITDNVRGLQDSGGRKTATEVRTSGEAAASRLAALARIISAQAITDLTEQMCLNTQQYMSEAFYLQVVGIDGLKAPIQVSPEQLVGDFYYPVHDGTLPMDRVALMDIWKELFLATSSNPLLMQKFNIVEMFKWIAELGGARNIEQFELQTMPTDQLMGMADQGQMIPVPNTGPSSAVQAAPNAPDNRLLGGL